MTFIPIRSKKHPGAVFIAERTPGVRDARFIAKVYPGPEAEREADLILTALRATVFREPTPGTEWDDIDEDYDGQVEDLLS